MKCCRATICAAFACHDCWSRRQGESIVQNNCRKFKATQEHYTWLQYLCNAIESAGEGLLDKPAVEVFQKIFDHVRDPAVRKIGQADEGNAISANISILRPELAVIKQRYILKWPLAANWPQVLALISE